MSPTEACGKLVEAHRLFVLSLILFFCLLLVFLWQKVYPNKENIVHLEKTWLFLQERKYQTQSWPIYYKDYCDDARLNVNIPEINRMSQRESCLIKISNAKFKQIPKLIDHLINNRLIVQVIKQKMQKAQAKTTQSCHSKLLQLFSSACCP